MAYNPETVVTITTTKTWRIVNKNAELIITLLKQMIFNSLKK